MTAPPTICNPGTSSRSITGRNHIGKNSFCTAWAGADSPVTLLGVPDDNGRKPVIDGRNAVSNTGFSYWNEDRQIILVGQNNPYLADHIIVDGFVLRNANRHNTYTDDNNNVVSYSSNACGLRTEYANHITVRNCEIYNNENGIQSGTGNPQE